MGQGGQLRYARGTQGCRDPVIIGRDAAGTSPMPPSISAPSGIGPSCCSLGVAATITCCRARRFIEGKVTACAEPATWLRSPRGGRPAWRYTPSPEDRQDPRRASRGPASSASTWDKPRWRRRPHPPSRRRKAPTPCRPAAPSRVREGVGVTPGGGGLVKAPKPGEEERVDLPTIGPDTVERAAKAVLPDRNRRRTRTIADRAAAITAADQHGLSSSATGLPRRGCRASRPRAGPAAPQAALDRRRDTLATRSAGSYRSVARAIVEASRTEGRWRRADGGAGPPVALPVLRAAVMSLVDARRACQILATHQAIGVGRDREQPDARESSTVPNHSSVAKRVRRAHQTSESSTMSRRASGPGARPGPQDAPLYRPHPRNPALRA